jgi:hypothetical protein
MGEAKVWMKNQNYPTFTRLQVCCIPLDFTSLKRYQLFTANAKLIDNLRINDLCYFCMDVVAWDLYVLHGLQAIKTSEQWRVSPSKKVGEKIWSASVGRKAVDVSV